MVEVAITGAAGFLGRYAVAAVLKQGYQVRAIVRPDTDLGAIAWATHPAVTVVRADLTETAGLTEAVAGVEALVHLAAAKTGPWDHQRTVTVWGTDSLCAAALSVGVRRWIAISSFSVYGYGPLRSGALLDETTPLELHPRDRDAYGRAKLAQENIFKHYREIHGAKVTILRPGIIYGPGALWNASLGAEIKGRRIWVDSGATLPLIYVEHCADAIAQAIAHPEAAGQVVNLVDDNLPTQRAYRRAVAQRDPAWGEGWTIPWGPLRLKAGAIAAIAKLVGQGHRLPGLLVPARLDARFKPLRYTNERAKKLLHWSPTYDFATTLDRSFSPPEPLTLKPPAPQSP
jgi:nucleoside-diphosphate-sugar epimerase